jgi:hypothetical protein
MTTEYEPELTFEGNVRAAMRGIYGTGITKQEEAVVNELSGLMAKAYEDGWMDARAQWMACGNIDEVPNKME